MSTYADTSFLVSLYAPDANSARAAQQAARAELPFLLTAFGELELINALQLRVFRKELQAAEVSAAFAAFRRDTEQAVFALKPLPVAAYGKAIQIARSRTAHLGARTLDILHVASALALRADRFYTFDTNQLRLAKAEGLKAV